MCFTWPWCDTPRESRSWSDGGEEEKKKKKKEGNSKANQRTSSSNGQSSQCWLLYNIVADIDGRHFWVYMAFEYIYT